MPIKLVVGLRNPGSSYEQTRHNAGAWFVAALAEQTRAAFKTDKKLHAELALSEGANPYRLVLPLTFMNLSGLPVREVSQFYRIKPHEILIVHDELDLEAGRIKLKTAGGHGGHNGLRDITTQLGTNEFHRLRVGIGHPGHRDQVLNYVLGKPSIADKELIMDAIARALSIMDLTLSGDLASAMNKLNS